MEDTKVVLKRARSSRISGGEKGSRLKDVGRIPRGELYAFRKTLPVSGVKDRLKQNVLSKSVSVIVGETGSGKTTQIPQILQNAYEKDCYEKGLDALKGIAITQPRRVAAMSVANRVAQEVGCPLGGKVGYSVRFDDMSTHQTRIKYLTDGMLLQEIMNQPDLSRYHTVIIDEAHERTVHTDVLLSILKKRALGPSGLRLVVMSATLEIDTFQKFFPGTPILYVPGRLFPIDVMYVPAPEPDYLEATLFTVLQVHLEEEEGDILVFLTGQEEIEDMETLLKIRAKHLPEDSDRLLVRPIFANLPAVRQMKVFEPAGEGSRKVILATNIAETSLTIPGVRYVVDPGLVKVRCFSGKIGFDSLRVVPISKAAARQRAGRAGREAPGKVFRLYQESYFHKSMDDSPVAEIRRTNLATVLLQLKAAGVEDVLEFEFVEPPPFESLRRSLALLVHLGALDARQALTTRGIQFARFPLDPQYSACLCAAEANGCLREVLTIIAVLGTAESVFFFPSGKRDRARKKHVKFFTPKGDHLTILNLFTSFLETKQNKQWCTDNFVSFRVLKKAIDIRKQLADRCLALGFDTEASASKTEAGLDSILRSLCAGFFTQAAFRVDRNRYRTLSSRHEVLIHPSSGLHSTSPQTVICSEIVTTRKHYMRIVSVVEDSWLTEAAPDYFAAKT